MWWPILSRSCLKNVFWRNLCVGASFQVLDIKGQKAPLPILSWENNIEYWRQLHAVLNSEIILEKQRIMLGMQVPLGIEIGKPFAPDTRQKAILETAALVIRG